MDANTEQSKIWTKTWKFGGELVATGKIER